MKIYKKDRRDLLPVYQKKTSNFYSSFQLRYEISCLSITHKGVPVKCETKQNLPKRNVFSSFRFGEFRFAFYRYPYFSDVSLILNQTDIIFTSFLHLTLFSVKVKTEQRTSCMYSTQLSYKGNYHFT